MGLLLLLLFYLRFLFEPSCHDIGYILWLRGFLPRGRMDVLLLLDQGLSESLEHTEKELTDLRY